MRSFEYVYIYTSLECILISVYDNIYGYLNHAVWTPQDEASGCPKPAGFPWSTAGKIFKRWRSNNWVIKGCYRRSSNKQMKVGSEHVLQKNVVTFIMGNIFPTFWKFHIVVSTFPNFFWLGSIFRGRCVNFGICKDIPFLDSRKSLPTSCQELWSWHIPPGLEAFHLANSICQYRLNRWIYAEKNMSYLLSAGRTWRKISRRYPLCMSDP